MITLGKDDDWELYHTVKSNLVLYTQQGKEKGFTVYKTMDEIKDKLPADAWQLSNETANHYAFIKEGRSCLECHVEAGHKPNIQLTPEFEKKWK